MRNMSFSKTVPQMRSRSKTVTRRVGSWRDLEPGTLLMAVEKGQGLGKGGKVKRIGVIRVLSVREEMCVWVQDPGELVREGFPDMNPSEFWDMLGVEPDVMVTRIEFEHVEEDSDE